jgi:hypothetical protein
VSDQEIQTYEPRSMSVAAVQETASQVHQVQAIMKSLMVEETHFGVIPGTKKPTLYQPGAQMLCFAFRLIPEYEVTTHRMEGNHREVVVTCRLSNQSGQLLGSGVGSCSTMESKYRYRGSELTPTGREVPKAYWDAKKLNAASATKLIGGPGFVAKKDDAGTWMIFEKGEGKAENPDVADAWNTVLKMAKKRAFVDATISTCAASDLFTQDLEDFQPDPPPTPPKAKQEVKQVPPAKPDPNERAALVADLKALGITREAWAEVMGTTKTGDMTIEQFDALDTIRHEMQSRNTETNPESPEGDEK